MDVEAFIQRWTDAPISERAHYQTFVGQLCRLLELPAPDDERTGDLDYCFERPVRFVHDDGRSHAGFIDCYRRGSFVLEAKQSAKRSGALDPQLQLMLTGGRTRPARQATEMARDQIMSSAKRQAENYARALDEWPPFLVLVDVGRSIELWSDFARQGKGYAPFPDRGRHRIELAALRDPDTRAMLARVWTDPMGLDPAQRVAEVTTDIAALLAGLVRSIRSRAPLGADGKIDPVVNAAWKNKTALFVMQCIFAMFADSVGLIRNRGFNAFLESYRGQADQFHKGAGDFFSHMDQGGHCAAIRQDLRRFNGGLFREAAAVPITEAELEVLIAAAHCDWASVEPAIFGALLEGALDPGERTELGAHYTPRAFVEQLVGPTIMEPLRADWEAVEASAIGLFLIGDTAGARKLVREFHRSLCEIRVLDPACGTGNFLYVAMRMMKVLEGEVLAVLAELGEAQAMLGLDGHTISPAQFWGLEKNPYAVWIAEMVMWIGYLQWHFQTFGDAQPSEPILKNFHRIQEADALIVADRMKPVRDAVGRPVTAVRRGSTGAERGETRWVNPRPRPWPPAHFIIGNPPFMGAKDMRRELGDGYVDALWAVRQGRFRSADLVTAWWDRAADILTRPGTVLRRFGFITTNSITQTFSRRVLEHHLAGRPSMRLVFAIADHPWLAGADGADVRIAMTVAEAGEPDGQGRLLPLTAGSRDAGTAQALVFTTRRGIIAPDLTVGGDVTAAVELKANAALCSPGVKLHGAGFIVTPDRAAALASASDEPGLVPIRRYRNGRDLADRARGAEVIDLFGWDEGEVRRRHPAIYQHLLETVKPDRDRNPRKAYRDNWWVFGEPRRELRAALEGLSRYIVTVETAKHRWFRFVEADILPDNKLIVVASDDPWVLGVLSSRVHRAWFVANAGRIGVYDGDAVYVKGPCFDRFPFPAATAQQEAEVAALAIELDELRQRVLSRHPQLTMTGLYNARERLIAGEPMTPAERETHEAGCITLLDHLHRRIDQAVAEAYGWPREISDEAIVACLLVLNAERAVEEGRGVIHWLRAAFQKNRVLVPVRLVQIEADLTAAIQTPVLPDTAAGVANVVLGVLRTAGRPVKSRELAARFREPLGRRGEARLEQTLAVLAVAGSVQRTETGWFAPRGR